MKKTIAVFFFIIFLTGCEKYDNSCDCNNPLEDLAWLKEIKVSLTNCSCRVSIMQATWHDQTVFYSIMNDPLCNSAGTVVLLDCNGNSITAFDLPFSESTSNEIKDPKVIYSCKTGE
jgi:hypothetical protein